MTRHVRTTGENFVMSHGRWTLAMLALLPGAAVVAAAPASTKPATNSSSQQQQQQQQPPPRTMKVKKTGLSPADEAALKGVMETCREIVSRNREVAQQLGGELDRFRRASDSAIRLADKAGAILRADYSGITEQPIPQGGLPGPTKREESGVLPG